MQLFSICDSTDVGRENLGILRIKAYLAMYGFSCSVHIGPLAEVAQMIDPDEIMYGMSLYQSNIDEFGQLCKLIKTANPAAIIVAGSGYCTIYATEVLERIGEIDYVILGHGETVLKEMMECISIRSCSLDELAGKNVSIVSRKSSEGKHPCNNKIADLPLPDRSYLHEKKPLSAYICDAHSCTAHCSFCAQRNNQMPWSARSAKSLFDEIIGIYSSTGIRVFIFTSGSFEDAGRAGKQRIIDFCNLLLSYPVSFSFQCYMRTETFKSQEDKALLYLMKSAGFSLIYIGVESANNEDLIVYDKTARQADNLEMIKMLDEVGIRYIMGFIMYNPYSTIDKVVRNIDFLSNVKSKLFDNYTHHLHIYKGTKIYQVTKRDNLLLDTYSLVNTDAYEFLHPEITEIFRNMQSCFDSNFYRHKNEFTIFLQIYYLIEKYISDDTRNLMNNIIDEIGNRYAKLFRNEFLDSLNMFRNRDEAVESQYELNNLYEKALKMRLRIIKEYVRDSRRVACRTSKGSI